MSKHLTNKKGDVKELNLSDFKAMRSVADVLPELTKDRVKVRAVGRPIADNHKKPISIRLDTDVVKFFKSQGRGWQTKINEVLKQHITKKFS